MILLLTTCSAYVSFKMFMLLWRNQACWFFFLLHNCLSPAVCGSDRAKALDKVCPSMSKYVQLLKVLRLFFFSEEDQRASYLMVFVNVSLFFWIMVSMPCRCKYNMTLPSKYQLFCPEELPKSVLFKVSHQTRMG